MNPREYPEVCFMENFWVLFFFVYESVGKIMKRFHSLKKNSEFQAVYRTGKSYANKYLVMYVLDTDKQGCRIGISASKKFGNSVDRHRFARLVRESFRLNEDILKDGKDIVVVARVAAKDKGFDKIESAFMHLCGLHNILKESK